MPKRLRFQLSDADNEEEGATAAEDDESTYVPPTREIISRICSEALPYFPSFSTLSEDTPIRGIISDEKKTVQQLFRRPSHDVFDLCSRDGTPALIVATSFNNRGIMKLLIDEGFHVDMVAPSGQFAGLSPLHVACLLGHMSAFNLLVDLGADLAAKTSEPVDRCGQSCLHLATKHNHGYLCNVIVSMKPALVNCSDSYGLTPLHLAAILGHTGLIRLFLRSGANADSLDKAKNTPLIYSILKEQNSSVAKALAKETNINLIYDLDEGRGLTALHLATILGKSQLIEDLIDSGADPNVYCTAFQVHAWKYKDEAVLPIHIAAFYGNVRMFDIFYKHTRLEDDIISRLTPLSLAVANEKYQMVRYLLVSGFCPNVPVVLGNISNFTALHIAAELGSVDLIEQLMFQGASPDIQTTTRCGSKDRTPLHLACQKGNKTVIGLLATLQNLRCQDAKGMTPLHLAVMAGCCEMTAELLQIEQRLEAGNVKHSLTFVDMETEEFSGESAIEKEKSRSCEISDKEGRLPVHLAAVRNNVKILETFLRCGEDINLPNSSGRTILHLAAFDVSKFLVLNFLILNGIHKNSRDEFGYSALHIATESNNIAAVQALLLAKENMSFPLSTKEVELLFSKQILVNKTEEVDVRTNEGQTALQIASRGGYTPIVECLIMAGADVNAVDDYNITALHLAASMGNSVVGLLIDSGAKLDSQGHWMTRKKLHDLTPLHLAVLEKEMETSELLLQKGADVNTVIQANHEWKTALHIALSQRDWGMAKLLISHGASVQETFKSYKTPLMLAIDLGAPHDLKKMMVSFNADVNALAVISAGVTGTPLEMVLKGRGNIMDLKLLVDHGADITLLKPSGRTVLHDVVDFLSGFTVYRTDHLEKYFEMVANFRQSVSGASVPGLEVISQKYIFDFSRLDPSGQSVFHIAVKGRNENCMKLLMEYCENPKFEPINGESILYLAVIHRSRRIVKQLLEAGASVTDLRVWMDVLQSSKAEHLSILHDFCVDLNLSFPLEGESLEGCVLHYAVLYSTDALFEQLLSMRLVPVDTPDTRGRTALCLAMWSMEVNKVLSLLSGGASLKSALDFRDTDGRDLIHRMVELGNHMFLSLLVLHSPNINRTDSGCVTALHLAAIAGKSEMIEMLVAAGSNIHLATSDGNNAHDLAMQNGHIELATYLSNL